MQRFKLYESQMRRDIKPRFTFYSKPEGETVQIVVCYRAGGMNYANYKTDPRGIYVSVQQMKRETSNGMTTESYHGFSGVSFFVQSQERFNLKKLAAMAERVEPLLDQIVASEEAGNREAIKQLLTPLAPAA